MAEPLPMHVYVPAWVYVLDFDHGVKVGITRQGVEFRMSDLARGLGLPCEPIFVLPCISRERAWAVEQWAHLELADSRTLGEWFHCHPLEAVAAVKRHRYAISSPPLLESDREAIAAYLARVRTEAAQEILSA